MGRMSNRETHAVQMERMRCSRSASGDGQFDDAVRGEREDATSRQKIRRSLGTAENLQENGNGGRSEGLAAA